jgi:copper chaperone CopZ
LQFIIEGMSCEACVRHLTEAWSEVPGVTEVRVDLAASSGHVVGAVEPESLIAIAADEGYVARLA